jgi:hypothetical protein
MKVWLPSCLNRQGEIDRLARSLNMNSERLGGLQVKCEHWPDVPAGVLEISWDEESPVELYKKESQEDVEKALQDTIHFVETRIAKLGLCPYTKSMKRAAIGLEALGVQQGPVVIRHAGELESSERATPAAVMGACSGGASQNFLNAQKQKSLRSF